MDRKTLLQLLESVRRDELTTDEALSQLQDLPFQQIHGARLDHHRALRRGFPEVIYGEHKTPSQVADIFEHLADHHEVVLCTRANPLHVEAVQSRVSDATYHATARCLYRAPQAITNRGRGQICVLCAGTADLPVAHEATLTAQLMGNHVQLLVDVGVAGLHRLLSELPQIRAAEVLIVVAGMEGALPSVVGGLCARPVIAVPTSIGYGASQGGWAALLGMLSACSAGISVVNIDNGFGAGYAAALINRAHRSDEPALSDTVSLPA